MAQNRTGSRGKYGSEALAMKRKAGMPDREYATVETMQTTSSDRMVNGAA